MRSISTSACWARRPASPVSAKPSLRMVTAGTPSSQHCVTTPWTRSVATMTSARSIGPGAELIRTGPFKYVRHPNYMIVAGEIAVLPLAFGSWQIAAIFSLLNLILVLHRIRVEEEVLRDRG